MYCSFSAILWLCVWPTSLLILVNGLTTAATKYVHAVKRWATKSFHLFKLLHMALSLCIVFIIWMCKIMCSINLVWQEFT